MECPKCCFSELDRVVRYVQELKIFQVKLGCPRCKTIWVGALIEESDDEVAKRVKHYRAASKKKSKGVEP